MQRRPFLAAPLALAFAPAWARTPPSDGPLRVGVDAALQASGLAGRLRAAFNADTGLAVRLVPAPAMTVIDAVRDGEVDVAIANVPSAEQALAAQSLVYDRRPIALGEYLIVGPVAAARVKRGRVAAQAALGIDAVDALQRIRALAVSEPGRVLFLSAADGSGAHVAEQALWRAAAIAPEAPWYLDAAAGRDFQAQVRARSAYAVVERGAWEAAGGGLGTVCAGDPALAEPIHAMRSFRAAHPAAKIFIGWIAGGRGRAVVTSQHAYRILST